MYLCIVLIGLLFRERKLIRGSVNLASVNTKLLCARLIASITTNDMGNMRSVGFFSEGLSRIGRERLFGSAGIM